MKIVYIIMLLSAFMLSLVCQTTTTDPRKGGLFSYNPEAYEKRLDDRRRIKTDLERQNVEIQQESRKRESDYSTKQAEQDIIAKQVASLDEELDNVKKSIADITVRTDLQKHAKWKINLKLKNLQNKLGDNERKEHDLKELKKELDNLLEEAEALSNL